MATNETALPQNEFAEGGISADLIGRVSARFKADPARRVSMNAIRKNGIDAVAQVQDVIVAHPHTFSVEIETGPITNQKRTGRCWMFAGANQLRFHVMKNCNLKGFELSQAYLQFWDKFERANYFLENILATLDEPLDGRLVAWLLSAPLNDGGQWDMFVNLVEKYGAVPKYAMPETYQSSESSGMNRVLTVKLRENARTLRSACHGKGLSVTELRRMKTDMLADVYSVLVQCLGEPPATVDFEYRDKDGAFHSDRGLTPVAFAQKYIGVNPQDYVSLIHAPTADKPLNRTYTVKFLGNIHGGRDVLYLNLEIEALRRAALAQLADGEPVWFGCDVGKMYDRQSGLMADGLYDYANALGVGFDLDKAGRLDYGESSMTHAMLFTGVNLVDGRPNRWKVENSWGKEPGHDGFFTMSDAWFDQYMYQVVVHKKYLTDAERAALNRPPTPLQPWDPMGALARG